MVSRLLSNTSAQLVISSLIVVGMLGCIFTPNYFLFKMGANYAVHITVFYLFLGILFLSLSQPRLTFISFACCAGMCLFLKYSANAELKLPEIVDTEVSFKVAHFNLASSQGSFDKLVQVIKNTNADIISLQEVTPDWQDVIQKEFAVDYPFSSCIVRSDPFGLAIFSKHPLRLDTFLFEGLPNLAGSFKPDPVSPDISFIASYITPPLYSQAYEQFKNHLRAISNYALENSIPPILTIGDYQVPAWWNEIQGFRAVLQLDDSRRSASVSQTGIFATPVDYIFHSPKLRCVDFIEINLKGGGHVGIMGTYQFNPIVSNAQATTGQF